MLAKDTPIWTAILGALFGGVLFGILASVAANNDPNTIPVWFFVLFGAYFFLYIAAVYVTMEFSLPPGDRSLFRWTHANGHNHFNPDRCPIDCPKNPYY